MLQQTFQALVTKYGGNSNIAGKLWDEIAKYYSGSKRHYHNLLHLEDLLLQLEKVQSLIHEWDTALFSLYYHDVIYNVLRSDNEEKSAAFAVERLSGLKVPAVMIETCNAQIIATKSHTLSDNNDTNYFTDADLSILGSDREAYAAYCRKIRKEYSVYHTLLYNPGRKKVLQHFLSMDRIFKTDFFSEHYEQQARLNLQWESLSLNI